MERRMGAAAEQDQMAEREQERSEESETAGGEREPGGRPWYKMGAGSGKTTGKKGWRAVRQ